MSKYKNLSILWDDKAGDRITVEIRNDAKNPYVVLKQRPNNKFVTKDRIDATVILEQNVKARLVVEPGYIYVHYYRKNNNVLSKVNETIDPDLNGNEALLHTIQYACNEGLE